MTIICIRCQQPMLRRIIAGQIESARCGCGNVARPTHVRIKPEKVRR